QQVMFSRYFTYCFILVDLLYSHSYVASLPFWYAGPGIVGFFSISSWKNFEMIRVAFQAWFFSFILVLLLITCSFVYRCGLLCRSKAGSLICSTIMQIEIVIIVRTPCITLESIETCVMSLFSQCFCGWNIHKTIIQRQMSNKLKSMHARALKLLISQALNPLFFIYIPSFVILFGMFVDADFGDIPKMLEMSVAFFPIVNPLIVIYFTDDYKRFVTGRASKSS
ncbi:hypothetical protein PFISCL1PPCAC_13638, partial [Pristionchus fissidentatus]